jgi:hypothetical protein
MLGPADTDPDVHQIENLFISLSQRLVRNLTPPGPGFGIIQQFPIGSSVILFPPPDNGGHEGGQENADHPKSSFAQFAAPEASPNAELGLHAVSGGL